MATPHPSAPSRPAKTLQAVAASAVLVLTLLAMLAGLWAEFVNWDDPSNILDNRHITELTRENLGWMWTARHLGVYEPLAWMLKGGIYAVGGGARPGWFHAVSWLLHGANAVLAFFLILRLVRLARGREDAGADVAAVGIAALFYSVHPLRVECVAWASGQSYLLAATFAFGAVLAYLRAARTARVGWAALAWLLFVAALLSKSAVVTLPIVLMLLDIYPLRRLGGRAGWFGAGARWVWFEKAAFAVPAIVAGVVALKTPVTSVFPPEQIPGSHRLMFAAQAIAQTLRDTIAPFWLSPFYPLPATVAWNVVLVVQVSVAAGVAACALFAWRRRPAVACAAACFLVLLAPSLGFVRHGDQLTADRYSYLAGLSIAALVAGWLARVGPVGLRVAGVGVIVLALLTWRQTSYWQDSETLWGSALDRNPGNWVANNNLAALRIHRADELDAEMRASGAGAVEIQKLRAARLDALAEARTYVSAALAAQPDYPDALMAAGMLAERESRAEEAIAAYRRAVARVPFHPAGTNLGAALQRAGRTAEAERVYLDALAADPANRDASSNLAALYTQTGRFDKAGEIFARLVANDSQDAGVLMNLGLFHAAAGRPGDALRCFDRVLQDDPSGVAARYHRAAALLGLGRRDEAVAEYLRCIAADPRHVDARAELAVVLLEDGEDARAIEQLDAAHRARPDDARVTNKLAWVLATTPDAAVRDPARALMQANGLAQKLNFGNAQALDTLAAAQAASGRFKEAVDNASKAVELARARGNDGLVRDITGRLDLYRQNRPYLALRISPLSRPAS